MEVRLRRLKSDGSDCSNISIAGNPLGDEEHPDFVALGAAK
jgi:hypothetical protein